VSNKYLDHVTPAEAGVQEALEKLDSDFRSNWSASDRIAM